MVIRELMRTQEDGANLYRTYSDCGMDLLQVETGCVYGEAIDIEGANYTYQEVEPEVNAEDEEISDEEFVNMLEEVL